jgi:hypothetical protein
MMAKANTIVGALAAWFQGSTQRGMQRRFLVPSLLTWPTPDVDTRSHACVVKVAIMHAFIVLFIFRATLAI